ncbi:polyprenyl synthetase family protein, partial [Nocardiopsis protaetiae]
LRSAARPPRRPLPTGSPGPERGRPRPPRATDPRTFAADRSVFVDAALARHAAGNDARGPRGVLSRSPGGPEGPLRPALALMLVEGAAVDPEPLAPLVAAVELFHTGSLAFDERASHLAGIALVSGGYGLMTRLAATHPPERVVGAMARMGTLLGPERLCRGRYLDRLLARGEEPADAAGFLEVYTLTASTEIEAALAPTAILLGLPDHEVDLLTAYAHHSGIVLRLRADLLAGPGADRPTLAAAHGRATAARLLAGHRDRAEAALDGLALDTALLRAALDHFATRRG